MRAVWRWTAWITSLRRWPVTADSLWRPRPAGSTAPTCWNPTPVTPSSGVSLYLTLFIAFPVRCAGRVLNRPRKWGLTFISSLFCLSPSLQRRWLTLLGWRTCCHLVCTHRHTWLKTSPLHATKACSLWVPHIHTHTPGHIWMDGNECVRMKKCVCVGGMQGDENNAADKQM